MSANQFDCFDTIYFEVIVRVEDLNFIPAINEEVLLDDLFIKLCIILNELHLLNIDTAIVIPYPLEDIRRLPWKYFNRCDILFLDIVWHLNLRKHVGYDKDNSLIFKLNMINELHLSIHIIV